MSTLRPETADTVDSGEIIGEYRLERLIGAGATSRVFLGVHTRLGRHAAVKVLSASLLDEPAIVNRLLTEARVVNDIRHPNIVDITDFIDAKSPRRVALIMEYIEGPSLKALRGTRLEFGQAIGITLQLVAAVQAAHNAGVIHRDIKPDNLLLSMDPRRAPGAIPALKVVDFGLAKIVHPIGKNVATGVMLGTPAYMAPEQIAGRPAPSPATDVYAIAEVLYELLSGERLFPVGNVSNTIRIKLRGPLPPTAIPADVPSADRLLDLIRRCVVTKPDQRPDLGAVRALLIDVCPEHILQIGSGTWGLAPSEFDLLTDRDPLAEPATDVRTQPGTERPGTERPTDLEATLPSDVSIPAAATTQIDTEAPTKLAQPDAPITAVTAGETEPPSALGAPFAEARGVRPSRFGALIVALAIVIAGATAAYSLAKRPDALTDTPAPQIVPSVQAAPRPVVFVTSDPPHATVRDPSGEVLGKTPLEVVLRDGTARTVEVQLDGHTAERVTLDPHRAKVQVNLQKRPQKTRPSGARPKPKEPSDRETFPTW